MPTIASFLRCCRVLGLALLFTILSPSVFLFGQQRSTNAEEKAVLSQKSIDVITEIQDLMEKEKYSEALNKVDSYKRELDQLSYDYAVMSLFGAQCLFSMGSKEDSNEMYIKVIPYLEDALRSGKYFPDEQAVGYTLSLANFYFATEQKDKAYNTIKNWIEKGKKPSEDMVKFLAILLIDTKKYQEALEWVQKALRMTLNPKVELYTWAAVCYQELGNLEQAAIFIERAAELDPTKNEYWAQLVSLYSSNGNYLGALNALERAQARGVMLDQRYYQTRAELYYNLERYEQAALLLLDFLRNNKVENRASNWLLASYCYQILKEEEKQVEVLREASQLGKWPEIDIQLANYYWGKQNCRETIRWIKSALDKGEVVRPHDVYILLLSAAIACNNFELAEWALDKAQNYPENESKVPQMRRYLESSRRAYEASKEEAAKSSAKTSKQT